MCRAPTHPQTPRQRQHNEFSRILSGMALPYREKHCLFNSTSRASVYASAARIYTYKPIIDMRQQHIISRMSATCPTLPMPMHSYHAALHDALAHKLSARPKPSDSRSGDPQERPTTSMSQHWRDLDSNRVFNHHMGLPTSQPTHLSSSSLLLVASAIARVRSPRTLSASARSTAASRAVVSRSSRSCTTRSCPPTHEQAATEG